MTRPPVKGYYNLNHFEEREGRRVVRRVPLPGAAVMDIKRIPEHETLAFLERHGYEAPRLLDRDPSGAWAIHSHVEGTPLHMMYSRGGPLPGAVANECARLLRELHALDAAPLARWCEDVARARPTRAACFARSSISPSTYARACGPRWRARSPNWACRRARTTRCGSWRSG